MTLVNRVSALFLIALAVCLTGYSILIYTLISGHLYQAFDQQLQSALNVLVAAVEVEPDGVKWQPSDHTITLGNEAEESEVRWVICDETQRVIDFSQNLRPASDQLRNLLRMAQAPGSSAQGQSTQGPFSSGGWRFLQQHLASPQSKAVAERDPDEFAAVTVTVGHDASGLQSDLTSLRWLVCVVPFGLWCLALVAGRTYCRHALRPLQAMARRARSTTAADFALRLPVSEGQDELSELANAFNQLLDRLRRAYEQQRRFTGDAAHQLRTPLTVLRGQIDVALRRPRAEAEYRQTLQTLSGQVEELQQLVEALLFLARTEEVLPAEKMPKTSISEWLPQHLTQWRSHPRAEDLALNVAESIDAWASPALLGQALDNLVNNALKYSPSGSTVRIAASANGSDIRLDVDDEGPGVPEEERKAIFEPFYRSPDARHSGVPGTGLGLSIVARIAHALGGSVSCGPSPAGGARFTLWLPKAEVSDRRPSDPPE